MLFYAFTGQDERGVDARIGWMGEEFSELFSELFNQNIWSANGFLPHEGLVHNL